MNVLHHTMVTIVASITFFWSLLLNPWPSKSMLKVLKLPFKLRLYLLSYVSLCLTFFQIIWIHQASWYTLLSFQFMKRRWSSLKNWSTKFTMIKKSQGYDTRDMITKPHNIAKYLIEQLSNWTYKYPLMPT